MPWGIFISIPLPKEFFMIKPVVGRHVWVRRTESLNTLEPEAAIIVGVNSDTSINVVGWNREGHPFRLLDLLLVHDDARSKLMAWPMAEWMPFQKGQAKAADAVAAGVSNDKEPAP
jgi:hypothetical protein